MQFNQKLTKLKSTPFFFSPDLNALGHGTFIPKIGEATNNLAYSRKKIADQIRHTHPMKAHRIYIESILIYMDVYLECEHKSGIVSVNGWKNISRYIKELIKMDESNVFCPLYEILLFNIEFHYLGAEAMNWKGNMEVGQGILKELVNLKSIFEKSKVTPFCVMKLGDLKKYVEEKLDLDLYKDKE